ncbi:MAG TPA: hypothetical protein VG675_22060 [Bryobacteraceae bacterium]|nr:hypothetical protein [Bryobacteraceae bacterium]
MLAALHASTIDVSTANTATLETGDSLQFQFGSSNYCTNAQLYGAPLYPTYVGFVFVSGVLDPSAQFAAELESADGSVSKWFDSPLTFAPGQFYGSSYSGTVATLSAGLDISPELSQQLFADSAAKLVLRNLGGETTVGLLPYTLQQDLNVSLTGGLMSVGAMHSAVMLDSSAPVPEPQTGMLCLTGLLFYAAWKSRRWLESKRSHSTVKVFSSGRIHNFSQRS